MFGKFRKITIIVVCLCVSLPALARPSIRQYRPVHTSHVYVHHDNSHDTFARNVAITALGVAIIAIIVAANDDKPHTTGDAGFDRYLEQRRWQGRN